MLEWNVYYNDFNGRIIRRMNVFEHTSFVEKIQKIKPDATFEEFSHELKRAAMYHFWAKCEYEVVVTSWPPYVSKEEIERLASEDVKYRAYTNLVVGSKVDIYSQLEMNWDRFAEYVYAHREELNESEAV